MFIYVMIPSSLSFIITRQQQQKSVFLLFHQLYKEKTPPELFNPFMQISGEIRCTE